jgi:hypothetical protein
MRSCMRDCTTRSFSRAVLFSKAGPDRRVEGPLALARGHRHLVPHRAFRAPSPGRVCHYVPISTGRAQRYIRSQLLLSTFRGISERDDSAACSYDVPAGQHGLAVEAGRRGVQQPVRRLAAGRGHVSLWSNSDAWQ